MRWMTWGAVGAMVVAAGYGSLRVIGGWNWSRRTANLIARLDAAGERGALLRFDVRMLDTLPLPVQRYLRLALTEGQPLVRSVLLLHRGTFNQSLTAPRWSPFTSTQEVRTQRPGFVWNATIAMAPGVPVRVHDAFVDGVGVLTASVFGLVSVANQRGTPSLAEGELMRWLAESAWYPTVLLPGQGVTWRAVNDTSADASISVSGTTVTLRFAFGSDGMIAGVSSSGRMRTEGAREVRTPWEGRFWRYAVHDGMRVPLEGEVSWRLPSGVQPYWRGTVTSVRYGFEIR